ncbi:hypothetical protein J6590_025063 [Homalodisca vitripennis]|nr:hypothetical protein J6590_025063 [Homalodisca vitripennis]
MKALVFTWMPKNPRIIQKLRFVVPGTLVSFRNVGSEMIPFVPTLNESHFVNKSPPISINLTMFGNLQNSTRTSWVSSSEK